MAIGQGRGGLAVGHRDGLNQDRGGLGKGRGGHRDWGWPLLFPFSFSHMTSSSIYINSPTISPQSFIEEVDVCHLFCSYFVPVVSCPSCPSPISFPLTFCPHLPSFVVSLTSSSDLSTVSRVVSRRVSRRPCPLIGCLLFAMLLVFRL